MSDANGVQFVTDAVGRHVGVLVPIALWNEIASERETAHLLNSLAMRERLLVAKAGSGGLSFDEARAKLGI